MPRSAAASRRAALALVVPPLLSASVAADYGTVAARDFRPASANLAGQTAIARDAGPVSPSDPPLAPPAQEPAQPASVSFDQLQAAIDRLGAGDYADRAAAARLLRRAPASQAAAVLIQAVSEHADGFVRFRSLILLTGFPDPRVRDLMTQFIADPNDRLRQVAYRYFEHNPSPAVVGPLLEALGREKAEFVRPWLLRALAAHGGETRVRDVLLREAAGAAGPSRAALVEALGDFHAAYAADALVAAARAEGPSRMDAALALGKLQDRRLLPVLAELQRSAPPEAQPGVAAAICLLGVNCSSHLGYLERVLRFAGRTPGYQPLVRGAALGLGAIAAAGNPDALGILLDAGVPAKDPQRAPLALALGTVALRNPALLLGALAGRRDRDGAVGLLAEAFEMLEEDFEKERFFATARRAYWQAPKDGPARALVQLLIEKLDF